MQGSVSPAVSESLVLPTQAYAQSTQPPDWKAHPPNSWRWIVPPTEPPPRCQADGWPQSLRLYLFSTTSICIFMWFYSLQLKCFGHVWLQWYKTMAKLILPRLSWSSINWLILPIRKSELVDDWWLYYLHLFKSILRDALPTPSVVKPSNRVSEPKPTIPSKQGSQRKTALAGMAMLATLALSNPMPLQSDFNHGKQLQRYKHPLGGIDTNKLSRSTSASSPHKALLTMLQNDSEEFRQRLNLDLPICSSTVDSGASFTSVNNETLVVPGTMTKLDDPIELDGIAGGVTVEYKCMIQFECVDLNGDTLQFETEAYYHPDLPTTLVSPQAFLHQLHLGRLSSDESNSAVEDFFKIFRNRVEVHIQDKHLLTLEYDSSFLPRMQMFPIGKSVNSLKAFQASVLKDSNKNLTAAQKVWLRLHHVLGHPSFSLVQQLAAGGYFDAKALGLSQLPLTDAPMCEACKYGKLTCKPDGTTTVTKNPEVEGALKTNILLPGHRIYTDQLVSVSRGRKFNTAGSEADQD